MKMKSNTSNSVRKAVLTALMAAPAALLPTALQALPNTAASNLTVAAGSASITANVSTLTINATDKTILNWTDFGVAGSTIATGEVVDYRLGSASAAILNRVNGTTTTTISGGITSDGKVFILNPNGIVISPGAAASDKINAAGGFYASTVQEPDGYFQANGNLSYVGSATTGITLTAAKITGAEIVLSGNGITSTGATSLTGNVTLKSFDGGAISTGANAADSFTVTKSLAVANTNGGTINLSGLSITNNLTVTEAANGGTVSFNSNANSTIGGDLTVNAVGNVNLDTGAFTTTVTGNASITTTGGSITNATAATRLINNGANSVTTLAATGKTKSVTAYGDFSTVKISVGTSSSAATTSTVKDLVDGFKIGATTVNGSSSDLVLSAVGNITKNGTDTVAVGGSLSLTVGAGGTAEIVGAGNLTIGSITGVGAAGTLKVSTNGNISIPAVTAGTIEATSTAGSIVETGAITSATLATFDAAKDINLGSSTNAITNIVLKNGLGDSSNTGGAINGVAVKNGATLNVVDGTAVTGDTTLTTAGAAAYDVVLGGTKAISFAKKLTIDVSNGGTGTGVINTTNDNLTVTGATTLTTNAKAVTIGSNAATNNASLGAINVTAGAGVVTLTTKGDLNLGLISTTGGLTAKSISGNIINSDVVTSSGATSFEVAAANNITLDKDNAISGAITLVKGTNVTINNTVATVVDSSNPITGVARFTVSKNNGLTVGGTLATTDFAALEFSASGTGAVAITDANALTLQNSSYSGSANVGVTTTTKDLTIGAGNKIAQTAGTTTFTATAGNIAQTGAISVSSAGGVTFTASSAVNVTSSGNNFSTITINAGADSALSEGGYMKIGTVSAGTKALTLTSETSTIEQVGATTITSGATTFNAPAGKVIANQNNVLTGNVSLTASGDSSVTNVANTSLTFGNVTVSAGGLTVNTSGTGTISEASGAKIIVFGDSSFTTVNNAIDLSQSGNQFGKVTLNTGGGAAASIKEQTTLNLTSVNVTDLTAESEQGSIIDTATGTPSTTLVSSGTASFTTSATGAGITIDNDGSAFASVKLASKGNVTFKDKTGGTVIVGGTSVDGTFTFESAGAITDTGSIKIFGNTSFKGTNITLNDSNNRFGAIKVTASGNVYIVENTTINLAPGTTVGGTAEYTSFGDIITSGTGGSTYSSTLRLNASGNITVSNPFTCIGVLTVNAPGVKDLSYLSKTGNLNNLDAVFLPSKASTDKAPGS